ncbi:hypothetical protein RB614_25265 [Phytohabitans sp. ZYX-F-186]|uniref:BON domain-containing protein n=1 Tax=Phytohabitans maris TaxID=3071409 RepID=A0ABU0ZPI2_9ACTN|nr:hypothetical protein [Phytohabitans sp. ZYX-F-186]MDQ7907837.1 hypothetical protein [Phytohabitans sp. ZYX-F-186]
MIDEYVEAAVQRLLTEHAGLAEQGISVTRREHTMILFGEVESPARRDEIVRLVEEHFPDVPLWVDIGITRANAPTEPEDLP